MTEQPVLKIERLGAAGDAVAHLETGEAIHLAGALPGESALVRIAEKGRADLVQIIGAPSPDRRTPPCLHAADCGGCALQHMAPEAIAAWKRGRIIEALARQGLEAEVAPVFSVPLRSRRRVRVGARRTKNAVLIGFHGRRSHQVVPIETCLIARPAITAALPALAALARIAAPRNRTIGIWVIDSDSGLDIALEDAKPLDLDGRQDAALWAEQNDVARLSWNGDLVAQRRPVQFSAGRATVSPPAGGFLQAAAEGEQALADFALSSLDGAARVADLFCGSGAFALRLAQKSEVLAMDGEAAAVSALEAAWRGTGGALKRVRAMTRDLFKRPLRAAEMKGLDAAIFDPPRAGAEAQARELAEAPFDRLVGISCNPSSFARDAAILAAGGWRLERVQPVDQFLFSAHVELAALFRRR